MTPANFNTDLEYSLNNDDFWLIAYKKFFGNKFRNMSGTIKDMAAQKKGIDRIIFFDDGEVIGIDEKLQRKVWQTILIEYNSNDTKPGRDGWITKDLQIDYIAYGFEPNKTIYFIPWKELQTAWDSYKDVWMEKAQTRTDGYKNIKANNDFYNTWSIAIPIRDLVEVINIQEINIKKELDAYLFIKYGM